MTDIRGDQLHSTSAPGAPFDRVEMRGAPHASSAPSAASPGDKLLSFNSIRVEMLRIAERAESLQKNAGVVRTAIETLGRMEDTIRFALDAATEAVTARSLPDGAVKALQNQLDLAVHNLDHTISMAVAAGAPLFSGDFEITLDQETLSLPRLGAHLLGGLSGFESFSSAAADAVPYSQSIASAASGGPNSLACCCDGAAGALRAGLEKIRDIKGSLERLYRERILPGVSDIAVTMANALASQHSRDDLDEVYALIADVRMEFDEEPLAGDSARAQSVLRLLE